MHLQIFVWFLAASLHCLDHWFSRRPIVLFFSFIISSFSSCTDDSSFASYSLARLCSSRSSLLSFFCSANVSDSFLSFNFFCLLKPGWCHVKFVSFFWVVVLENLVRWEELHFLYNLAALVGTWLVSQPTLFSLCPPIFFGSSDAELHLLIH